MRKSLGAKITLVNVVPATKDPSSILPSSVFCPELVKKLANLLFRHMRIELPNNSINNDVIPGSGIELKAQ